MNFFAKAAVLALFSAGMAHAHDYTVGPISIGHPMAFETAPNVSVGGGYMTLENTGTAPDRLVEVRVPTVPRVELHLSETDANGVARMIKQDGIEIPAGQTVSLQPGGLHVMFMGLKGDPFEVGEEIDATLVFENAGEIDVVFSVEARTAGGHGGMDHGTMDHGTMDHSGHKETN